MQVRALVLAVCLSVAATAAIAAEKVFNVTGVVRASAENGRIAIAHDDIAGYMPAMTMRFNVADADEAAALKPGDRVQFRLHVDEDSSKATDFVVMGHEAAPQQKAAPPSANASATRRLREGDTVPDFSLLTETEKPLTSADLRGRLTVVTFIFTRCPVPEYCPAMALRFGQLQKAILADPKLASRARLLSITLDPENDRPAVLKAYGEAVGANPAVWNFATGSKEAIAQLTAAFSVYAQRNGVTIDHTLCTALIDGDGRIREIWRGNGWRAEEVVAALSGAE
jgi:protein SCO1/2